MSITSLPAREITTASAGDADTSAPNSLPWHVTVVLFLLPVTASLSRWASFSPGAGYYPYFYRLLIAILGLGALAASLRGTKHDLPHALSALLIASFAVWFLFIRPPAAEPSEALQTNVGLFIQTVALFTTVWFLRADTRRLYYFRAGIVTALALQLFIGVWEVTTLKHLPTLIGEPWPFTRFDIPIGAFVNTNNYMMFLLMCLGPTAIWFIKRRSSLTVPALIVICTVITWMIIVGQGVAALALFTIYLFAGFYALFPNKAGTTTIAGYILFIVVNVGLMFRSTNLLDIALRAFSGTENESLSVRLETWQYNLQQFMASNGLGIGPGNIGPLFRLQAQYLNENVVEDPHNTLLHLLTEFGLVVALPMFILIAYVIFNLFSGTLRRTFGKVPEDLRLLKVEGQAVFFGWITASVVASSLLIEVTWWQFFAYQIVICQILSNRRRDERNRIAQQAVKA